MNNNFADYVTGVAFSLVLSKAQVKAIISFASLPNSIGALSLQSNSNTHAALITKGLVEYTADRKLVLTQPGRLLLAMLKEAGLVEKDNRQIITSKMINEIVRDLT